MKNKILATLVVASSITSVNADSLIPLHTKITKALKKSCSYK